jgi:elongation factor Ts
MATITAKDVAALRAKTGIGMMECKKALVEADGDMDAAIKLLREKGELKAESKMATRIAADGIVDVLAENGKTAIVEVNTETDFVAKNEKFQEFVKGLLRTILNCKPADVEALNACNYDGSADSVEVVLKEQIFKIGEKISIRRFAIVEGILSSYIHGNGTMGVVVNFEADEAAANNAGFAEYSKNIALQIAANPCEYIDRDAVPAEVISKELEIIMTQIKNDPKNANKPDQIIEKMAQGKIGKYYEEHCLVDQEYVKDDKMKVSAYTAACAKEFGGKIAIKSFVTFTKGEGLEKREENFAEEIAKLVK